MKYTQEQEKNMESEEMKKELNDAIQSADMQSLRRILRLMREDNDINSDYFIMNFDNNLFKNRDYCIGIG